MYYFDHAATTPLPSAVCEAMYGVLCRQFGNPSAQYPLGHEARELVSRGRAAIAAALGCPADRLFFTSCGTESDNWAIAAALHHNRRVGRHIITSALEHNAVLEPCKLWEAQGCEVTRLQPNSGGEITVEQVRSALRPDTALVSLMLVNNELGTVTPIAEIASLLKECGSSALLHTDAVQGFLKVPCTVPALGADFVSLSAHKIGGPKGIGALYISPKLRAPRPLLAGGGQESGLRSGTEAVHQIVGFAEAVRLRSAYLQEHPQHMAELRRYAVEKLSAIDGFQLIGAGTAPHILCGALVGYPSANIVEDLGAQGICISAGSACHRGKLSHVVQALHLPKRVGAGVIRISFGVDTTTEEIDILADALRRHRDTRFPLL